MISLNVWRWTTYIFCAFMVSWLLIGTYEMGLHFKTLLHTLIGIYVIWECLKSVWYTDEDYALYFLRKLMQKEVDKNGDK